MNRLEYSIRQIIPSDNPFYLELILIGIEINLLFDNRVYLMFAEERLIVSHVLIFDHLENDGLFNLLIG